MKSNRLFSQRLDQQTGEIWFFLFVSVTMVMIGGFTLYSQPDLREPIRAVPFVLLFALHIGLYWVTFALDEKSTAMMVTLIAQGIIALLINLIGSNMALPLGLYMGLIGLAVGVYKLSRTALMFVAAYLVLSLFSFSRVMSWANTGWWLLGVIPTMIFVVMYVTLYNRQAEARARAQRLAEDLESANRQLSEYAAKVEALTLSTERQRMARELHDTLSQGLAGLILQLEAADAHLASSRAERARAIIQQAMAQARITLADARRAIDDLRQSPNDLGETVAQETLRFTQATGIPCELEIDLVDPVPAALCEPAQRAVAEALTNVARHARASQARVSVTSRSGEGLQITIEDNGMGFDPQTAAGKVGHYGLLGIRERARLAGGTLEIESQPGLGTKVRLHLPYTTATGEIEPARSQL